MKKIFLIATAALLVTGLTFADNGKKKSKAKGKTCTKAEKSCTKSKTKTAKI